MTSLGHDLVGQSSLGDVAPLTASLRPDAAIVIVGESSEHALDLIGRIVTEAACPVIAILDVEDEAFISEAAKRGIFAYITKERDGAALQSSSTSCCRGSPSIRALKARSPVGRSRSGPRAS